ncbi:ABC transporter permease [Pedobacter ginsengisoli]|uniref:ABC transporter permease n=1 Tax=Pedobacter ginsengisoli TaxID=363852 RepID=A0A2D1U654_9SPHI|nr:ABC transporter permease [Pedobacter ginsengisoli]ATP57090.1 ABC transporter permease [Pedobacter ginsengisoli]
MFKLNLKIALRNLWKHKAYALINIAGLAIGMASCILIFIFIRYQLSFDDQFVNKNRIFRIVSNWESKGSVDASQGVPVPLSKAIRNDISQFEKVAAIQSTGGVVMALDQTGKTTFKEDIRVFYTQPEFFDIFDFTWLAGIPQQVLNQPNTVVLSEEKAIKYFGTWQQALGKTIRFRNKMDLKVTGVFKELPENTTLTLNVLISYANYPYKDSDNWGSVGSSSECYVLLKKGIDINSLDGALAQFNKKYYKNDSDGSRQFHTFQPLKDIHQNSRYGNFSGKSIEKREIYSLSVIGAFLLLTACINFINLATAQAVSRSKEVGIRKVMGSRRKQLVMQFLGETLTISIISVLIACVLTEFALPYMQNLFDEQISFSMITHPVIFVFLIVLVLVVSFLAGFYPSLIMSGFSPALAIKNKVAAGNAGGLGLRKILVVIQFTITIILIISTLVVLKQMNYMRQQPLGFNPDAVAMVGLPGDSLSQLKYTNLKERILTIPGVSNLTFCDVPPSSNNIVENNFSLNNIKIKDFQVRMMHADFKYFETFDLKLIAGKLLTKSDTANGYVVNQTFLKMMNIKTPEEILGRIMSIHGRGFPIVGVIKDFNDKSLRQSISPIAFSSQKNEYYNMAIKMDSKQIMPAMKQIEKLWNETFSNDVYNSQILNDDLNNYYNTERVMGVLFRVFSAIIIFISFIGLFGLISFVASQRTREVAIRKVLGASNYELVRMLNGSFLLMVFLANLVAWPVAYIFVSKWLNDFAYRIPLSIWPFAIAMIISMTITFITVSLRSYKAAQTKPIDALKYE